ncbi:MAG: DUF4255 domain-containing protein [Bryobacteraceae bacterium]|nr:DUF4255 domain-containing protein [Bryobacteraceae bacterium]
MPNLLATHSVGNSLINYLRNAYPQSLRAVQAIDFRLLSTDELAGKPELRNVLSLLLYRITQNEHLRNTRLPNAPSDAPAPLSINLHFLLTVWAGSALVEHSVLTWAMRELHRRPVFDLSILSADAAWAPGDVVNIIPEELNSEEIMRIWDTLDPKYRLSVSYVARVVRIDDDVLPTGLPVVATRLSYQEA